MVSLEAVPAGDDGVSVQLDRLAMQLDALAHDALRTDGPSLLEQAEAVACAGGARRLVLSAEPAPPAFDELAAGRGFSLERDLLQLRRPLPIDEAWELAVRPFVPGRDEEAWLEVNRRAFAWHPEQGRVTAEDLRATQEEPWFDADGFLLHESDGRLAGFCWTKIHRETQPVLGEIFVIGVDPDFHGQGLGRPLTLAGLDWLARRGVTTGMLYVESDNEPARRLYDDLGFRRHHSKRWYAKTL